jgi:hypothetical protein
VVDSTKFTDWLKALRELFIDVSGTLGWRGNAWDSAFDAKPVLNTIASRGYIPIGKRVMGLGLGIGHTMNPYMRIGASVKGYSEH